MGEICVPVQRNDPYSHAPVMMITASSGFIYQSVRYSFDNSGQSLQKYTLLKKGELAYNHGASKLRPFGSCFALNVKEARIPFVYHSFAVNDDDPEFVSLELNGTNVEKQLRKLVSSGARMDGLLNISFDDYGTVTLPLPSIDEQKKISSFFLKLDSLLTLHQRKWVEFFYPTYFRKFSFLNFWEFFNNRITNAWEQRSLGEICVPVQRNDPYSHAPVMMITASSGFIYQSVRYSFDNSGQSLQKYTLLKKGELAYNHGASKLRPFGSCFALNVKEARIPFVYHSFAVNDDDPEFVSLELNGTNVEKQLRKLVSSGARMDGLLNISFDDYGTVTLPLPSIDEQKKISSFFLKLDSLLTLHQRQSVSSDLLGASLHL